MPIRKRMSPIASSARSKRRMRPKRRKKPPVKKNWRERKLEMRLGEGGENGGRVWVKGLIWGDLWGFFFGGGGAYLPPVQNATPISGGRGLVYYTCCSSRSIGR